jgi:hypothetical protein
MRLSPFCPSRAQRGVLRFPESHHVPAPASSKPRVFALHCVSSRGFSPFIENALRAAPSRDIIKARLRRFGADGG